MALATIVAVAAFVFALDISPRLTAPSAAALETVGAVEPIPGPVTPDPTPIVVRQEVPVSRSTPVPPAPTQVPTNSPPSVLISTPSGSVVVDTSADAVSGSAFDSSGLASAKIYWRNANAEHVIDPELSCNAARTTCTWTSAAPQLLGTYEVVAVATDSTGRTGSSNTVSVTVVSTAGAPNSSNGPIRNLIGGVVSLLS